MSESPSTEQMAKFEKFENIWDKNEREALQALNRQRKITRFLVIDHDNPDVIRDITSTQEW